MLGNALLLTSPEGPRAGLIKIDPELPLRPLGVIFEEVRTYARRTFAHFDLEGPMVTTTAEGEYATVVNVVARDGDVRLAQHTACFVLGDTSMAALEARTSVPERFESLGKTIAALTRDHAMGLGRDRWRRYHYVPPPGWTGVPLVRATAWLHPRFPRASALITVYDARPVRPSTATALHNQLFAGLSAGYTADGPTEKLSGTGTSGEMTTYTGTGARAFDVRFIDSRYAYGARLECDPVLETECVPLLRALVRSIRPLPPSRDAA